MLTIMTEAYTTDLFLLAWLFSLWIWKMGKKNSLSILTLILTISLQKGLLKLVILLHLHLKESYSLLRSALYFSWHYTQCFLQDICISHHRRQENNNRKSLLCKTWSIKKKKSQEVKTALLHDIVAMQQMKGKQFSTVFIFWSREDHQTTFNQSGFGTFLSSTICIRS